jgi:predicted MPP superfamily phosphohydrolase
MKKNRIKCVVIIQIIFLLSSSFTSYAKEQVGISNDKKHEIYDYVPSNIDSLIIRNNFDIIYPRSTIPSLVEHNGEFTIKFKADEFEDVYAYVSTSYEPVIDEFWLENKQLTKEDSIWHLTVFVSPYVTEELYNLTLLIYKNNEFYSTSQPRAVNVYSNFSDNFNFVHITDFHYGDPRGFAESIRETIGFKSIKRCIKEINLLHPDFVLITGDVVFGQLYPFEYRREYKKCYDLIQQFDVPTFLVPGNHDGYRRIREDGLKYWEKYFGSLYYSFDYGEYHFLAVNSYDIPAVFRWSIAFLALNWGGSISDEQLAWIENDLKSSDSKLNLIFLHHNPIWETRNNSLMLKKYNNREGLIQLISDYDVDMVLAGHVHFDTVEIRNGTIFLTTTTPESDIRTSDGYWGYRLIKIKDGKIESYNYKEPKYSIPSYKLDKTVWVSESLSLVIIKNDLEMDITAYLKFTMPYGDYDVKNGEIVMRRHDDKKIEIYVKSNVTRESQKTIILSKSI